MDINAIVGGKDMIKTCIFGFICFIIGTVYGWKALDWTINLILTLMGGFI